ncbi:hypothetical protein K3495_g5504 [Podosphaera aphanis]|nr:hypothetical protein K3495_g5504 [Podosphaera aphanis]
MSYYDIDAILTDAEKVPCTFELAAPRLGYLNNAGHALKAGTHIELPLWLAEMLAVSSASATTSLVTLDVPPCLAPRVMNALKADPLSVDIRALAQNFYGLGARILELFEDDEICDVLMRTWQARAAEIGDHASHAGAMQRHGSDFLKGLDEAEKELFRASHESSKAMRVWMKEITKN